MFKSISDRHILDIVGLAQAEGGEHIKHAV